MKQYRLPVIMHQPGEDTENKYMAEVPILTGCRAWGDTPEEALENLRSVAGEFMRSFKEHKQRLPKAVEERGEINVYAVSKCIMTLPKD